MGYFDNLYGNNNSQPQPTLIPKGGGGYFGNLFSSSSKTQHIFRNPVTPKLKPIKQQPNFIQQAEQVGSNLLKGAENIGGNIITSIGNEFKPQQTFKPPKVGKITPTQLPSGIKLNFVEPTQNVAAKSLQQQKKSVEQTFKIVKSIQNQIDITKNQALSGFSDLQKGLIPTTQVMPRIEYKTQQDYNKAVKDSKSNTIGSQVNKFLGQQVSFAPAILLGGWLVDPITAEIAGRVPAGVNIVTNILSLMAKGGIKSAPYGALAATIPAKNFQERLKNTAIGIGITSIIGVGLAGATGIASELVNKFGMDAENFLANRELIQKVVNGQATPKEVKQFNILNESGLTAEVARSKTGISINAQTPKTGKMWDILRYIFSNKFESTPTKTGEPSPSTESRQNVTNLLKPGEYKPADVRKVILNSALKNDSEAQQIINHSIQAEQQGKNIQIVHEAPKQTTQLEAPKKTVYNSVQSRAIQTQFTENLDKLRQSASNEQDLVKGINESVLKAEKLAKGDKTVLAGIRTALNKEMYGIVGSTGNYKQDYAILQQMKKEGGIGDVLRTLEDHIQRISDEMLKPAGEIIAKPIIENKPLEPVGTGKVITSKLASSVEQNAIEKGLTKKFGDLPEYKKVNLKEQSQMATDLLKSDPNKALQVALGNEQPPSGLLPEMVFTAVEQQAIANKDVILLRHLATQSNLSTQATAMGQRIRALGERDVNSPVKIISDLAKSRKVEIEKKLGGKSIDQVINDRIKKVSDNLKTQAPKKDAWNEFIDSIQC